MAYKAECEQTDCEYVTQTETKQEAIEAIEHHTDQKHANMDLIEDDIRESITHIE